jgi:signal transduction histidine kinase
MMVNMKKNISSTALVWWWKITFLYVGGGVYGVFIVSLIVFQFNLFDLNLSESFVLFINDNIFEIYLVLGIWGILLIIPYLMFRRLVYIQVDEQASKIYFSGVEVDGRKIIFIVEVVFFDMLIVLLEKDGVIVTWIPMKSTCRDTVWPLPFFVRRKPKNQFARLLCTILRG